MIKKRDAKKNDINLLPALLTIASHQSSSLPSAPSLLTSAFPSDLPQVLFFPQISEKEKERKRKEGKMKKKIVQSMWKKVLPFNFSNFSLFSLIFAMFFPDFSSTFLHSQESRSDGRLRVVK